MTQVTFYLLENSQQTAEQFACRLVEKAWRGGLPMHIHTEDESDCTALEKLLWSWREDSFLPHCVLSDDQTQTSEKAQQILSSPITVGFDTPPADKNQLLINLSHETPAFFRQFKRVCEIVLVAPDQRTMSRNKFRSYRQSGIEPEVHHLTI